MVRHQWHGRTVFTQGLRISLEAMGASAVLLWPYKSGDVKVQYRRVQGHHVNVFVCVGASVRSYLDMRDLAGNQLESRWYQLTMYQQNKKILRGKLCAVSIMRGVYYPAHSLYIGEYIACRLLILRRDFTDRDDGVSWRQLRAEQPSATYPLLHVCTQQSICE